MTRSSDLKRFYEILGDLESIVGGKRRLIECDGRMNWPLRGVYFFFESGENRSDSGEGLRVVRVGTHALKATSKSTLWNRLSQHCGTARGGGGNHRGSIFRLLVGSALMNKEKAAEPSTWGVAGDPGAAARKVDMSREAVKAGERVLEQRVSDYIRRMPFLWVATDDAPGPDSTRGIIERNAIALLSNFGKPQLDEASGEWLGRFSDRERVRASGMWNNDHVAEQYDVRFLEVLEQCTRKTMPL